MNICGCLLHVAARATDDVRSSIASMDGVEIHAESDDGRFVVVVEDTGTVRASDQLMALHQLPGVISLTLNYHHFEDPGPRPAPASHTQET